jgi:O-antigen/teichoic acid export membrane protein
LTVVDRQIPQGCPFGAQSAEPFPGPPHDLRHLALRSAKWSLFGRVAQTLGLPALYIALARWLTPDDYGVIGLCTTILALITVVQQVGFGPAVVQRASNVDEAASVAFWLTLTMGTVLYALVWVAAPLLGLLLTESRVVLALRVLALQSLFSAISVVPTAFLQRGFHFRALFLAQASGAAVSIATAVPLAVGGAGYWALIVGSLAGSLSTGGLIWVSAAWRPSLVIDWTLARQLTQFTGFVLLEALLGWFLISFDNLVVGIFLGTRALGIYTFAFNIAVVAVALPLAGITGITLPTFSRLHASRSLLRDTYIRGTRLVAAYAVPAGVAIGLIGSPAVAFIYGPEWRELGPVLAILGLYSGFGHLWVLNTDAFKAVGRPDIIPRIYVPVLLVMVPVYIVSARYGLLPFTVARSLVVLLGAFPHTMYAVRLLKLPTTYLWSCVRGPLLATVSMSMILLGLLGLFGVGSATQLPGGFLSLAIPCALTAYLGTLYVVDRALLLDAVALVRQSLAAAH